MMKIILASASPRRFEIMKRHGIEPFVMPAYTDEEISEELGMCEIVETLSARKAGACYEAVKNDPIHAGSIIVGADTIVWKDGMMGKPVDRDDAFRMLDSIRGTSHYVVTGVTLIDVDTGRKTVLSDITTVFCKNYTDDDINEYISSEEPYDKAGSYAIQGYFGRYIDHIEGDYENVVGFPFYRVEEMLLPYGEGCEKQ